MNKDDYGLYAKISIGLAILFVIIWFCTQQIIFDVLFLCFLVVAVVFWKKRENEKSDNKRAINDLELLKSKYTKQIMDYELRSSDDFYSIDDDKYNEIKKEKEKTYNRIKVEATAIKMNHNLSQDEIEQVDIIIKDVKLHKKEIDQQLLDMRINDFYKLKKRYMSPDLITKTEDYGEEVEIYSRDSYIYREDIYDKLIDKANIDVKNGVFQENDMGRMLLEIRERRVELKTGELASFDLTIREAKNFDEFCEIKEEAEKLYVEITNDNIMTEKQLDLIDTIKECIDLDLQGIIRNIIEIQKNEYINKIKYEYANSKQHQRIAYNKFKDLLKNNSNLFDEETNSFSAKALRELERETGIDYEITHEEMFKEREIYPIDEIDKMDGMDFEKICADILSYNGFENIEVTQGSGDQGIDVLTEKDGIKYAIQCKRYSSKLGNTPIQEVHAGRKYYKCQIGVVMTNNYFTPGAINLANETGTLLWDRDKLIEMLNTKKGK